VVDSQQLENKRYADNHDGTSANLDPTRYQQ
jgi:hypothetical protein